MNVRTLGPAAIVIGAALLLATACGGGGGEPPATPTPEPTETPASTATPEPAGFLPRPTGQGQPTLFPVADIPTVTPPADVVFHHPLTEDLRWGGPDGRVYSRYDGHCGNSDLTREFGVPGLIAEGKSNFYLRWAVERQETWRWTGHFYADWQIWQGDEFGTVYLVHTSEELIAFRYRLEPHCI